MRAELGAAEHAKLTKRRAQIIEEKAALISSQPETKSKTAKNPKGAGRKKKAASVSDQASKTGESRAKVARSKKRAEKLGEETLDRVTGTSLDNGAQLDALAKLDADKCEELIKQAEAGEKVSAVGALAADAAPSTEPIQSPKSVEYEIAEPKDDEVSSPQYYGYTFFRCVDAALSAARKATRLLDDNHGISPNIARKIAEAARNAAAAWSALAASLEQSMHSAEANVQPPERCVA